MDPVAGTRRTHLKPAVSYSWHDIAELLEKQHGPVPRDPLPLGNKADPYDELIYILLTVMTRSQGRIDRAFDGLVELSGGRGWGALLSVGTHELIRVLEPLGLVNRRLGQLLGVIRAVEEDHGGSLDHLAELASDDAMRALLGLPGVGTKTAKCVLMYSLGFDVLPTDIHVLRVAARLGKLQEGSSWVSADRQLESDVPDHLKFDVHVQLVRHGREICKGPNPQCSDCLLRPRCPTGPDAPRLRSDYVR